MALANIQDLTERIAALGIETTVLHCQALSFRDDVGNNSPISFLSMAWWENTEMLVRPESSGSDCTRSDGCSWMPFLDAQSRRRFTVWSIGVYGEVGNASVARALASAGTCGGHQKPWPFCLQRVISKSGQLTLKLNARRSGTEGDNVFEG